MTAYLTEADVETVLTPADAVEAIAAELEANGGDVAAGGRFAEGPAAILVGTSPEHDLAAVTVSAASPVALVIVLDADGSKVVAVIEARRLRALRAAATSALAARLLARPDASSLGLIGCGELARAHVECLRASLPGLERVAVYCRSEERRRAFAARHDAVPVEYGRDAAEQDIVVTATTSRDPVLRGDWLAPGGLVCAAGATRTEARELDNLVLERATFVCCDSLADARYAAGDLVEPVERGVLDWLEVHELPEVLAAEAPARQSVTDIAVFKNVGTGALDLVLAAIVVERARALDR